jgi:glycosyltransferase involved in cell wall biosynthesis
MNSSPKTNPIRVLIVQQINRAYRVPLLKRLSECSDIELTMVYGTSTPVQAGDIGISIFKEPLPFRTICGPISGIRFKGRAVSGVHFRRREILWFGLALQTIKQEYFDVVICDYYARLLSIWPMIAIQHRRKAKFILWGIGFHQIPTPWLDKIRIRMVNWTDALLLYSEKESNRYQEMGVPKEKCFVAQNTVDIEGIDAGIAAATHTDVQACREQLGADKGPILMHAGRLAANKRLDFLIQSLSILRQDWPEIKLVLIGEGPEHKNLSDLANELSISDSVHFLGAITDHKRLAPWILASDLFVAPAQIGLMAPMCLAYGKTLVISDVLKHHGPEVQAFIPERTGLTYKHGDAQDLTEKISHLLADPGKRKKFAEAGSAYVRDVMGPERMLDAFLDAIHYVTGRH